MANLRNIKNRISSIKNTQKITRAMKMVAAAKVKKAEAMVKMSRPFTFELYRMFIKVYAEVGKSKFEPIKTKSPLENYPALLNVRSVDTVALVVISSNKGLAGAYSANIVRFTLNKIKELNEQNKKVVLYLVGQKTLAPLKNAKKNLDFEIREVYTGILDDLTVSSAEIVAQDLAIDYVEDVVDEINLITTRYINTMTYKVEEWTLLPTLTPEKGQELLTVSKFHKDEFDAEHGVKDSHLIKLESITEFLPCPEAILQKIVPMYLTNVIYQTMLEAQASELSSRMTAMSAATNNAEDMIKSLTVQYNKVRQEKITQELTEIVGASLMK